ncbi:alcohol dehydrogenase [Tothia fuscella]|uniref:Alcohol dehydrogenase n=1 Tax=Tothia fuscella TaxID=1048955 RepID=A0A9P4P0D2_9PEZI|nr:alcohol dehydrogenase [Tothia fuscella]
MATQMSKQWTLETQNAFDGLQFKEVPIPTSVGEHEVLVEIRAASLNYRDIVLAKGSLGLEITPGIVPGSDGAGIVKLIGSSISKFQVGDKVCTHMVPSIPDNDLPTYQHITNGMGEHVDGTIREFGVFHESCLMHMPNNLSFEQASTLTCSALTAWNGLFGLKGREVKKGDWVLTQGTGGVSIAALQFAVALGATVVATTSSDEKAAPLKALGASHVINYRTHPKWGESAKQLTPNAVGFDHVVDVGGHTTLAQSLKAVRIDGVITAAGLVGGMESEETPLLLDVLWNICTVRGVLLGTRKMFRDMNMFIDKYKVEPAVDDEIFRLEDATGAYKKLEAQKHFAKVIIKMI